MFRNSFFLPVTAVVKNLIIANVIIFIAQRMFSGSGFYLEQYFAEHHFMSPDFRPHQLLTAVFMHGSWGHLFGNMLALFFFGSKLEMVWGAKRFLQFYLICGIGASLISSGVTFLATFPRIEELDAAMQLASGDQYNLLLEERMNLTGGISLGASGAVFGILAAAAYLFPNDIIYIDLFIPMKMKWMALLYGGIELLMAIQNNPNDQVGHVAHLGGGLVGFLFVYFGYRRNNKRYY